MLIVVVLAVAATTNAEKFMGKWRCPIKGWHEEEEVVTGTDELVGMLKKNIIIILTLPKLLKRTIS